MFKIFEDLLGIDKVSNPDGVKYYEDALIQIEKKYWEKAKYLLGKSISINSKDAKSYNKLGYVYYMLEKYVLAIQHLDKALKFDPHLIEAYLYLSKAYHIETGNIEFAFKCLFKAVELDNSNYLLYQEIASLYFYRGDINNAVKYYEVSLKYNKENVKVLTSLGKLYGKLGNSLKKIDCFSKAVEIDKSDPELYFELALVFTLLNDFEKAKIYCNHAIKIDNRNSTYYDLLSMIYSSLGFTSLEMDAINKAIKYDPNNESSYKNGWSYTRLIISQMRDGKTF